MTIHCPEGHGVCEKTFPDSCVASVGKGRFKLFRHCSDHRRRARMSTPFVDVESVITPPPCLDEGQFRWAITQEFQEVPENMTSGSWTVTRSRPWWWTESVHIGEARSMVEALRLWAAVEGGRTVQVLLFVITWQSVHCSNEGELRAPGSCGSSVAPPPSVWLAS